MWSSFGGPPICDVFDAMDTSCSVCKVSYFLLFPSHIPPPLVKQLSRRGGRRPQIMTFESPDSCLKTSYLRLSPPRRETFVPSPSLRSRPLVVCVPRLLHDPVKTDLSPCIWLEAGWSSDVRGGEREKEFRDIARLEF